MAGTQEREVKVPLVPCGNAVGKNIPVLVSDVAKSIDKRLQQRFLVPKGVALGLQFLKGLFELGLFLPP